MSVIELKSDPEIALMREAGLIVAAALAASRAAVAPGQTTADLDAVAEKVIRGAGAIPSFKGYQGFPATLCTSINDEIVHGIPNSKRPLREGDIVSIDCGAIVGGFHGDSAITVGVGDVAPHLEDLMRVCEDALWRGLAAAHLGGRVTDIGAAIEGYVRPFGYGIVEEYVGHGIGTALHQPPNVPNFGKPGRGPKLERGLVLAVEPMVNLGTRYTRQLEDGWTVVTQDGLPSAHFEHTFTLTDEGPWVLTAEDGGRGRLADLLGRAS
ncbi:MAG: type I methionyl aminopeptidase [Mycobacteriales bacterium]